MHVRHEMPVPVERRPNGRMPHLDLDGLRMRPLGNQEARIGMPQIMEPYMARDTGLPQGPREAAVRQVVGIERLPISARVAPMIEEALVVVDVEAGVMVCGWRSLISTACTSQAASAPLDYP